MLKSSSPNTTEWYHVLWQSWWIVCRCCLCTHHSYSCRWSGPHFLMPTQRWSLAHLVPSRLENKKSQNYCWRLQTCNQTIIWNHWIFLGRLILEWRKMVLPPKTWPHLHCTDCCMALSLPRVINFGSDQFQISTASSPEILHQTVWRTWLFIAY